MSPKVIHNSQINHNNIYALPETAHDKKTLHKDTTKGYKTTEENILKTKIYEYKNQFTD